MKAWILRRKLAIQELTVLVLKSSIILKIVTAAIGLATGVKITIREDPEEAVPMAVP
jgi:hypothetical protein